MADGSAIRAIQAVKQLGFMEEALQRIAKTAQVPSITITDAKRWLRAQGGHKLASKLSRASKVRNGCAHPDVGWLDEVDQVVQQRDNSSDVATNSSDDRTTSCSDGCKELEPDGLGVRFASSVLGEDLDYKVHETGVTAPLNFEKALAVKRNRLGSEHDLKRTER